MSLVTINCFTAGSDERRPNWTQDCRRFAYDINNPTQLFRQGWKNTFEFQAFNGPVAGTIQIYVQEAGEPHRSWVERKDATAQGWTPKFCFWAYSSPQPGTVAYYVHCIKNGGTPEAGPFRFEISGSAQSYPGWEHLFTFYAFPSVSCSPPPNAVTIESYAAGNDAQAAAGNCHRTVLATGPEAKTLPAKGWTKVFEFQALNSHAPGTALFYVRGNPSPVCTVISRAPAGPGYEDVLKFFAYENQVAGTVAYWIWQAGSGAGPHDPIRTEVTSANLPIVRPGWRHVDTFYAYPRAISRSLSTVHVYDAEGPRRFGFSVDGIQLSKQGWRYISCFDAPNTPQPGTFPIHIATTVTSSHVFYADRQPGSPQGWTDMFCIHGYSTPVDGTIPYYVMRAGGSGPQDPIRYEITTNPAPHPGWVNLFIFYAYPKHPESPPTNPY